MNLVIFIAMYKVLPYTSSYSSYSPFLPSS